MSQRHPATSRSPRRAGQRLALTVVACAAALASLVGEMPPATAAPTATAAPAAAPAVAAAAAAAATAAAAAPTVPPPEQDPFYATVPNVGALANGSVVRTRRIDAAIAFLGFRVPTTSWQLAYKSLDAQNAPLVNVTTLMVPTKAWTGTTPRPVVAYQNAEDSTAWRCAASYSLRTGSNLLTGAEQSIMATALDRGFALAIADHEGPQSAFLAGPQSAHVVLDGIRAVQAFAAGGVTRSSPVGLWGYSGGGHATAWAAEQAGRYAPDLRIAGAAFGGAPPVMADTVRKLDGGPFTAFTLAGVAGLTHAYPQWDIRRYLNAAGLQALATADNACIADIGVPLSFTKNADLTTVPDILAVPSVAAMLRTIDLGQAAPVMPTYIYYTPLDEAIAPADTEALIRRYCAAGTPVVTDVQWFAEHATLAVQGSGGALDFLGARFAGRPLSRTDCR